MLALRLRELKSALRAVPGVFWLAGMIRYADFKRALAFEERTYDAASGLPPPRLRYRVHGTLDAQTYVAIGAATAWELTSALRRHGITTQDRRVLDFGCGPGRVAVHFKRHSPGCELLGTDIDTEAVQWADECIPHVARFLSNGQIPPLPFADGDFDVAYTVSVFTHLDEAAQVLWLRELSRVVKPGGIVIATVHGRPAQAHCTRREREQLAGRGFAFRVGHTGRWKLDGLPASYQTAFHRQAYVQTTWARWFDVLEYCEGGLHGHQDLVVLRSRGVANEGP